MNKWIRPFEVAKLKNVSYAAVIRWIREGKVTSRKIKKEVERWEILEDEKLINLIPKK